MTNNGKEEEEEEKILRRLISCESGIAHDGGRKLS